MTDTFDLDLALTEERHGDAETVTVLSAIEGAPVDEPDSAMAITWSDVTKSKPQDRPPLIPAWLRSRRQRAQTMRQMGRNVLYYVLFHLIRSPKYAAKTVLYAPRGLGRTVYRMGQWAAAEEGNASLRQHAAKTNDAHTWLSLNKTRAKEAAARCWLAGLLGVPLFAALAVVWAMDLVPTWAWQATAVLGVLLLARVGRPSDKAIIDRVMQGRRFTKLTGEMVRSALMSLALTQIKEASQIEFVHPGIHRDGPGWLARVNLPAGLEAVKVLERRGALSSALRLPVDQVWPSAGPDHAGQLDLWVGYQPASKMGQPPWALAEPNARTSVFEPNPFGTDERQRPISITLFENNVLIGGQPGSGKSYGARTLATIAMLDPTCEMKIAEFKGTGDFMDMGELCSTYACGVGDEELQVGADIIDWALAECERRGKRIKRYRETGEAPLGKVTPELARRKGSGLHPVFILLDEVHELFGWDPEVAKKAERAIKRGRALGIIIVLATQIPDKTSLPPNITRCVSIRWCMSVGGQVENDMILGTGAYKRGLTGTAYRPKLDAGWGVMMGLEKPGSVRSFFPTPKVAAQIVARGAALRGGVVAGPEQEKVKVRNLLEDVLLVLGDEAGAPWDVLAGRLRNLDPDVYKGMSGEQLREAMKGYDVPSQDVKVKDEQGDWKSIKGLRRTALEAALRRHLEDAPDAQHQLVG